MDAREQKAEDENAEASADGSMRGKMSTNPPPPDYDPKFLNEEARTKPGKLQVVPAVLDGAGERSGPPGGASSDSWRSLNQLPRSVNDKRPSDVPIDVVLPEDESSPAKRTVRMVVPQTHTVRMVPYAPPSARVAETVRMAPYVKPPQPSSSARRTIVVALAVVAAAIVVLVVLSMRKKSAVPAAASPGGTHVLAPSRPASFVD